MFDVLSNHIMCVKMFIITKNFMFHSHDIIYKAQQTTLAYIRISPHSIAHSNSIHVFLHLSNDDMRAHNSVIVKLIAGN